MLLKGTVGVALQELHCMREIDDEAKGVFHNLFDAMQWRRNRRVWVRLSNHGDSCMLCEVVDVDGTIECMSNHELYSVMAQKYWQLKPRACEKMQIVLPSAVHLEERLIVSQSVSLVRQAVGQTASWARRHADRNTQFVFF